MNWNLVRGLTYVAMLAASLLAFFGLAEFNPTTGMLTIHPFNAYGAAAALAGVVSSGLASIALLKGWGRK
jgi:hypothetical protein